jgi:2-octaprenyl-6-methoxyphenol hydroxylase
MSGTSGRIRGGGGAFPAGGPFAILPLTGKPLVAGVDGAGRGRRKLLASDDFVFLLELERRFGHRLGAIELDGPRQGYPLSLTLARDFVRPRFALLGDAAHGIHPIAGQGLNLGFRDAAALAETLVDAHRLGLDIGALDVLRRYERWRRYDTWQMGVTTGCAEPAVLQRLGAGPRDPRHRARPRRPAAAAEAHVHRRGGGVRGRASQTDARRGALTS